MNDIKSINSNKYKCKNITKKKHNKIENIIV